MGLKATTSYLSIALLTAFAIAADAQQTSDFNRLVEKSSIDYESFVPAAYAAPVKNGKAKTVAVHAEVLDLVKDPKHAFQIDEETGLRRHAQTAAAILDTGAEKLNDTVNFDTRLINHRFYNFDQDAKTIIENADILTLSSIDSVLNARPIFDVKKTDALWDRVKTIVISGLPNDVFPGLSLEGFSPLSRADTVIRVASWDNAGLELGPDVVYPTAFDEGFCFPYVPREDELKELFKDATDPLMLDTRDTVAQDIERYRKRGGKNRCDLIGNSFASPHLGGLVAGYKEMYPDLHEYEVMVALLTSTRKIGKVEQFKQNARGLDFADIKYGFGMPDPEIFKQNLEKIRKLQAENPGITTEPSRQYSAAKTIDKLRMTAHIENPVSALQTMGFFKLSLDPKLYKVSDLRDNPLSVLAALPSEAKVTSPSGTMYKLKLHAEAQGLKSPQDGINFTFATTGWLGEDAAGDWTVEILAPAKAKAQILSGEITVAGMKPGGPIDTLIDSVTPQQKKLSPRVIAPVQKQAPAYPSF